MSLVLKISLTIIVLLIINGSIGGGILFAHRNDIYKDVYKSVIYAFISCILLILTLVYIPIMFIWHLY